MRIKPHDIAEGRMGNCWQGRFLSLLFVCLLAHVAYSSVARAEVVYEKDFNREVPEVELLAQGCFGCHGPEGRSGAPAIPSLAGLPAGYFIHTMEAYQYGGRLSTVMGQIARGYEEWEIEAMADYFSRIEPSIEEQRVDSKLVNLGRKLHRYYCRECHGDRQKEPTNGAVRLNGQWADYLRITLKDYLVGINQTDDEMSEQLIKLVKKRGWQGLEALVHYYASARR
jgi:sulfide dehydrogenase cytochrome subunit